MKRILLIFNILFIFSGNIFSQNISKGYEYLNNKEYDKAEKIFVKTVNKGKDIVAGKYGLAVLYTRPDYQHPKPLQAYKYLKTVDTRLREFSSAKRNSYEKNYGISLFAVDTLKNKILNDEFQKAVNSGKTSVMDYYITIYGGTTQADKMQQYKDSLIYDGVKKDPTIYNLKRYINDFPDSKYLSEAKYKLDSAWTKEYNSVFRSLEIDDIIKFEKQYPDYPYYNDSTKIYKAWAIKIRKLAIYNGYLPSMKNYYGQFIKETAPSEMAYQTLLVLISPLLTNNKIQEAIDTLNKYKAYFGKFDKIDKTIEILKRPKQEIKTQSLSPTINSSAYEYMPVLTADEKTIYFCAEDRNDNYGKEDIFVSYFKNGQWTKPYVVKELSTVHGNEAPLSISADGNTLLIFSNGDVFISHKTKYGWSAKSPISAINTTYYWEADATITADGNAILFSSDRYGNVGTYHQFSEHYHGDYIGNLDLYVIIKQEDGTWSAPINLGPTINTPYAERTPFLHPDMKTLYFASDGHPGLGKMDIFKATRLNDTSWTEWSEPVNLGLGINTPKKEYGYKISTDGTKAYYTQFLKGQSDIYYLTLPKDMRPEQVAVVSGYVKDKNNNPLDANIVWENLETNEKLGTLTSDPQTGYYTITLPIGKNYGFFVSKTGFYPLSDNIDLRNQDKNLTLNKDFTLIAIDDILKGNTAIELHNVFFDFNKYNLKKESFPELDRLAEFIKSHENIKIEISGHTDSKGADEYNLQLSQKRADAVKNYLISKGCNAEQLISKGYGSQIPVADNNTDEGRQQNRRVEFKVLK